MKCYLCSVSQCIECTENFKDRQSIWLCNKCQNLQTPSWKGVNLCQICYQICDKSVTSTICCKKCKGVYHKACITEFNLGEYIYY